LWELYNPAAKSESIPRVAECHINRIDIPGEPVVKLEDYLRTYPEVSADMPNRGLIANFFMQVQLWQEDLESLLIVNETPVPSPDEETSISIQLDFDLFQERFENSWPAEEEAAVWSLLEQLHDRKNEVFEASITDKTRRLFT